MIIVSHAGIMLCHFPGAFTNKIHASELCEVSLTELADRTAEHTCDWVLSEWVPDLLLLT